MADDTTQRAAHQFFIEHLQTLEPFTKADVTAATGWDGKTLETYWSKQFKNIIEPVGHEQFRVRDRFRQYLAWKAFKNLVTQVKVAPASYAPTVYDEVVVYEFYMPLSHESALKQTLDTLFYKDVLLPRLQYRIGVEALKEHFEYKITDDDNSFLARVLAFIKTKFGGYSIYHVDGRFRAGGLLTQDEAFAQTKAGSRYLVDETTAVTRFVFPCKKEEKEAGKVRLLFEKLFMEPITEQVSGEDEIWVVESGSRNLVQVWKPKSSE
jgi:hypothetical protein